MMMILTDLFCLLRLPSRLALFYGAGGIYGAGMVSYGMVVSTMADQIIVVLAKVV